MGSSEVAIALSTGTHAPEERDAPVKVRVIAGAKVAGRGAAHAMTAVAQEASDAQVALRHPTDSEVDAAATRLRHGRFGYRLAKRAFDIVFSITIMAALCWLYAGIAVAVKLDSPGPAIFRQTRVGRDGREFTIYKFRSMFADAEDRLGEVAALNEKDGPVFKIADDPRVTRVGRALRKLSLDELPQFANVLKGDLSVVGPRPALPTEVEVYGEREMRRLLVEQGVTCYWQTRRNRDSITFDEWVDLDLLYVKNCSVWADLKLVVQTIGVVLTAQGS